MKTSVVFFGSGPVAAKSLELLNQWCDIEAVITKPQPPHHKEIFPVIKFCHENRLTTYYATNQKELLNIFTNNKFQSSVGLVIDYGILISKTIIDSFDKGIINSHFSLLPQWRGADPITSALLNGQSKTGVSIMLIDEGLDTGKLLTFKSLAINSDNDSQTLTGRLINLSNDLLIKVLPQYLNNDLKPKNQPHPERATYSNKITKEDGIIDWSKSAQQIEREIRAYIDWPKSKTTIGNHEVIITKAQVVDKTGTKGSFKIENETITAFCGEKALLINRVKPSGKKEMSIQEFIRGYMKSS